MMQDNGEKPTDDAVAGESQPERKPLSPAAERALAEAQARRAEYDRISAAMPKERGGRGGQEPVRYGDWEKKGLATDF
jgi:hypothetical protein